jgi:hypothetical protein
MFEIMIVQTTVSGSATVSTRLIPSHEDPADHLLRALWEGDSEVQLGRLRHHTVLLNQIDASEATGYEASTKGTWLPTQRQQ